MARRPEIGNVQLYPDRPLRKSDRNGYVLKFYCPLRGARIRVACGTRDRREARRIQRECRERLIDGRYAASGGRATAADEARGRAALPVAASADEMTWDAAFEHYRKHRQRGMRPKSAVDANSRIDIAGRIFAARRGTSEVPLRECATLAGVEYLRGKLLDGAECRYPSRSVCTVNTMMGAVLTFLRYCREHEWIDKVPRLRKLEVDEPMRGRPITTEEFERMLAAVPKVVGDGPAASWRFALRVLWESGLRVDELMDFSWDDETRIHPVRPRSRSELPTIFVPSTQKNRKNEEIPLLDGLQALLDEVPEASRTGFVVHPLPIEFRMASQGEWFRPGADDLRDLARDFGNSAIARACGVSDPTVRKWLEAAGVQRGGPVARSGRDVPPDVGARLRSRAVRRGSHARPLSRLTTERVSRIVARIGEAANVVVRAPDAERGRPAKYASAHDLRRSLAERLINAGVSAETLMVILRHKDFGTTRRHYGARRAAQAAAAEVRRATAAPRDENSFVGG